MNGRRQRVEVVLIYQSLLGLYGDRGNATVLMKRLAWRGYEPVLTLVEPGETRVGRASIVGVECEGPSGGVSEALQLLRARGCSQVFVEGGGVTVSAFLQADLLDRLQIAIAPVIIGDGRPAIRLAPHSRLSDCRRRRRRCYTPTL